MENVAYEARRKMAEAEKQRIAARAAALVPHHSSLFINIGTTTEEVARHLTRHEGLLVITNNIHVASILMPSPGDRGDPRRRPPAPSATAGSSERRPSTSSASSRSTTPSSASPPSTRKERCSISIIARFGAAQAIIENARKVILVADAIKFTRSAPVRIAHISEIDIFVTDRALPQPVADACRKSDVRVEVVEGRPSLMPLD